MRAQRWRSRAIAVGTGALLVGLLAGPAAATPERVNGGDRLETAVAASEHGWDAADTAVVAYAWDFPDAMAGTALAADRDAPLLLTDEDELSEPTAAELERLGVDEVLVLGGTSVVSDQVVDQLEELPGSPEVERRSGIDRYETAAEIAEDLGDAEEVVFAAGERYPDAMASGALAAGEDAPPILLVNGDTVPEGTLDAVEALEPERGLVVGGETAVSAEAVAALEDLSLELERIAGSNRYETSAAVAAVAEERATDPNAALLATGDGFADSLAAGSLAARTGALLTIVAPSQPQDDNDAFLRERADRWNGSVVLGGSAALSDEAVESLARSMADEDHPEPEPEPEETEPARWERAVEIAHAQLGKPYSYGATGPGAFDCSGLTSYVTSQVGVSIPRTSSAQYSQLPNVSRSEARPGDIVAFRNPVGHVGLYIGGGQMIEASRPGVPVRIASVDRSDLRGFVRPPY